jgi:hypothetical protein
MNDRPFRGVGLRIWFETDLVVEEECEWSLSSLALPPRDLSARK